MKKIALISPVIMFLFMTACSGEPSKDGENQVPQPVQNSGPNTEGERAVEAVKDSVKDSSNQPNSSDTNKMSEPH